MGAYTIRVKSDYVLIVERDVPYPVILILPHDEVTEKTVKFLLGIERWNNSQFNFSQEADYQVNFNTELFLLFRHLYPTV